MRLTGYKSYVMSKWNKLSILIVAVAIFAECSFYELPPLNNPSDPISNSRSIFFGDESIGSPGNPEISPNVDFINFGTGLYSYLYDRDRSFSISLWMYPREQAPDVQMRPLISNESPDNGFTVYAQEGASGNSHSETYDGGGGGGGGGGSAPVLADQWNHLVWIFGSSGWKLYINGAIENDGGERLGIGISDNPLLIGASIDKWDMEAHDTYRNYIGAGFDGDICDVAIWSAQITESRIASIFSGTYDYTSSSDLLAYWSLDEGGGQNVIDSSTNGHDGFLGSQSEADENDPEWTSATGPFGTSRSVLCFSGPSTVSSEIEEPNNPVSTAGLVAEFTFSGGISDTSGYGHTGVNNGAVLVADRHGNPNSAYSFFDGDHIEIELSSALRTDTITICAWILVKSFVSSWQSILSYGWDGHHIAIWDTNVVGGLQGGAYSRSQTEFNTDEWYFVCMSRDDMNDVRIYVNGVPENNVSHPGPTYPFSYMWVGDCPSSGEDFDGYIDDIQIYSGPLSHSDVLALYTTQK